MYFALKISLIAPGYNCMLGNVGYKAPDQLPGKQYSSRRNITMGLVDSVKAGKLTISELIDTLAKDEDYSASKWDQRYREFMALLQ